MKQFALSLMLILLCACSEQRPETSSPPATELAETAESGEVSGSSAEAGPAVLESTDQFQATATDFGPREEMPGAALYALNCASCHNGSVYKAPHFHWLELMSPRAILAAMEGVMARQSAALDDVQRRQVAEYITLKPADTAEMALEAPACEGERAAFADTPPPKIGWGHDTRRYAPAAVAGMTKEKVPSLELKWSFAFPGALRARSQPAYGWGALYVGSQDGRVYAFDLETGCQRWSFPAAGEVRTGVVLVEARDGSPPLAVFGDILARVYAVNAHTGEPVWSVKADGHPSATLTGTPALAEEKLLVPVSSLEVVAAADPEYPCCSFRGKLLALDVRSGETLWTHYTIPQAPAETARTRMDTPVLSPSGAPVWTSPAVDTRRNRVYIGTGENYSTPADGNSDAILAIDLDSGERVWQRQSTAGDAWNVACMMAGNPNCPPERGPDFDHGSSMILLDVGDGKQVLLAGHKNGTIFGLDPDNDGALLWSTRVGRGSIQGGVHFGMAAANGVVFAPINDMNDTYNGDDLDAANARPGVHALDAATGNVLWSHVQSDVCDLPYCDPGVSAPVSVIDGALFAGHLDGFLRAYDAATGEVIWEDDTKAAVTAVNGLEARGGGMSGAGPLIVDGHVVVNSGYGLYFHEPGNKLAVYSLP